MNRNCALQAGRREGLFRALEYAQPGGQFPGSHVVVGITCMYMLMRPVSQSCSWPYGFLGESPTVIIHRSDGSFDVLFRPPLIVQ